MGKNVPLRIGRKTKRELNPVERMRHKEKQKKHLNQFISKMNKKASGEFVSKVKPRRSPSPESNDPMLRELISSSSLRHPTIPEPQYQEKIPDLLPKIPETIQKKAEPRAFVPISLVTKSKVPTHIEKIDSESSSSDYEDEDDNFSKGFAKTLAVKNKHETVKQNQTMYKSLLENDEKLNDFFSSISHLM